MNNEQEQFMEEDIASRKYDFEQSIYKEEEKQEQFRRANRDELTGMVLMLRSRGYTARFE